LKGGGNEPFQPESVWATFAQSGHPEFGQVLHASLQAHYPAKPSRQNMLYAPVDLNGSNIARSFTQSADDSNALALNCRRTLDEQATHRKEKD
jgi:hypothetical protein